MSSLKYPIEEKFVWLISLPFRYWRRIVLSILLFIVVKIAFFPPGWHLYHYERLQSIKYVVYSDKMNLYIYLGEMDNSFKVKEITIKTDTAHYTVMQKELIADCLSCHLQRAFLYVQIAPKISTDEQKSPPTAHLRIKYSVRLHSDAKKFDSVIMDNDILFEDAADLPFR